MKVYFEEAGEYTDDNDHTFVEYNVYVKPNGRGEAYVYDLYGKLSLFSWADKDNARCFNHNELPPDLWYSFTHSIDSMMIPVEMKDTWKPTDLIYTHLTKESVAEEQRRWEEIQHKYEEDYFDIFGALNGMRHN